MLRSSFDGKGCGVLCGVFGDHGGISCTVGLESPHFSLLIVICSYLSYATLHNNLCGVKPKLVPFRCALEGWRSWSLTLISFIQWEELVGWAEPLGTELCWPEAWNNTDRRKLFFPPFMYGYSWGLPLCFCSFLTGLQSSSTALLIHE